MISAQQIKELRGETGAGVSDVKKALEESDGDVAKARAAIERRLGRQADKRQGRQTSAGLVEAYIHSNARIGSLVEILCETDFVARTPGFRTLAHDIAMQAAAMGGESSDDLMAQSYIKDPQKTVGEIVREAGGRFGEHIAIGRCARFEI